MLNIQHSFKGERELKYGQLYLVATPVGNLQDMTFRAVKTLEEVDIVAAEDTRQSKKLMNHFELTTSMISYHEHNKSTAGEHIINELLSGKNVALVSDAGTPAISDPGYELVQMAIENGISVIPIPGANAAISALVISGLPTEHFYFEGFLPRDKKRRKERLERLQNAVDTMILYEAPHRLLKTLSELLHSLGDRSIVVARELTKTYEEVVRGRCSECIEYFSNATIRGEFCIVIEGAKETKDNENTNWWSLLSLSEHVDHYMSQGCDRNEAMRNTANDRQVTKREVYQLLHT